MHDGLLYHGGECTRATSAGACPRRFHPGRIPNPPPATASRRCCSPSWMTAGSCLHEAHRAPLAPSPARSRSPAGSARRGRGPRDDGAARDRGGARAAARGRRGPRCDAAGPHVRLRDPGRPVRRHARTSGSSSRPNAERSPRCSATRSPTWPRSRPRSSGRADGHVYRGFAYEARRQHDLGRDRDDPPRPARRPADGGTA